MHLTDEQLNEYLDNEIVDRAQVELHLFACDDCAARLTALRALFDEIESLPELALSRDIAAPVTRRIDGRAAVPAVPRSLSEFGRRASESGSLGTDHGHECMMMVLGGNVNGGKVHGEWPGMREGQLIGPGDLVVTTDYRDVLSEILTRRLNNEALSDIFPNHEPRMVGIIG